MSSLPRRSGAWPSWCSASHRVFSIDPRLALAIVRSESNFEAQALSPRNARGLMQLHSRRRPSVSASAMPGILSRTCVAAWPALAAGRLLEGDVALVSAASTTRARERATVWRCASLCGTAWNMCDACTSASIAPSTTSALLAGWHLEQCPACPSHLEPPGIWQCAIQDFDDPLRV